MRYRDRDGAKGLMPYYGAVPLAKFLMGASLGATQQMLIEKFFQNETVTNHMCFLFWHQFGEWN